MPTRLDTLRRIAGELYPMRAGETKRTEDVELHLLSVILLLSTRDDVLAKVFPATGSFDPQPLYDLGVDPHRVPREVIEPLRQYRQAFANVQVAWLDLSGYTDPPCPPDPFAIHVVNATK